MPPIPTPILTPRLLAAVGEHPLVELELGPDGEPLAAVAVTRLPHPPERVWPVVSDVERFAKLIPMIHRARREGDLVHVDLRFKVALFTAKFSAVGRVTSAPGSWLDLAYVSGEPRGLAIRFELAPIDDGKATVLATRMVFDPFSLGWLVSFFLKHHPEIRFGVVAGSALTLIDAVRRSI